MSIPADQSWGANDGGAAGRLGHHAGTLLICCIVAVVAVGLWPPPGVLMFTVPLALVAAVLVSWTYLRRHDRRLCEQCVHSMPLDPAARAARLTLPFRLAHAGSEPRFVVGYLVLLVASNFAMSTVGRVFWAVMQLSMIYLIVSYSSHRALQPWCPWCQGGGGGQEVEEPDPTLPHDDRQNA